MTEEARLSECNFVGMKVSGLPKNIDTEANSVGDLIKYQDFNQDEPINSLNMIKRDSSTVLNQGANTSLDE